MRRLRLLFILVALLLITMTTMTDSRALECGVVVGAAVVVAGGLLAIAFLRRGVKRR